MPRKKALKADLTFGRQYRHGPYRWSHDYIEVTISLPGYGCFKKHMLLEESKDKKAMEQLRIDGAQTIKEVIEKHSQTWNKQDKPAEQAVAV